MVERDCCVANFTSFNPRHGAISASCAATDRPRRNWAAPFRQTCHAAESSGDDDVPWRELVRRSRRLQETAASQINQNSSPSAGRDGAAHVKTDESSILDLHEDGLSLPRPPAIIGERPSVCADRKRMSKQIYGRSLLFNGKDPRPWGGLRRAKIGLRKRWGARKIRARRIVPPTM